MMKHRYENQRREPEESPAAKQERPARPHKKKRVSAGRILVYALIVLAVLAAIAFALVSLLLGRVTRPAAAAASPTPSAALTPTPAPAVSAALAPGPSATPIPTPTPTPLPLLELYPQTLLSDEQYTRMAEENQNPDFRNVLLIGLDRRGSSGNSSADTMMIATVDKAHGRLKLSSLLRDMLVEIPGRETYGKLNSAAAYGGMELLMETINKNFRLDLHEYVLVDFNMFIEIVDRMDGVTVSMTAEEISAANDCIAGLNKQWGVEYLWDGFIFAEAGNVKCTGKQALGYARIRHLDSDFKRTNRQYKVLTAIYAKFRSLSAAKQYSLLYDLLPMVETNMQNEAILDCALQALSMNNAGILQCHAPAENSYASGRYERKAVLLTDITHNALLLHDFIFLDAQEPEEATVLKPGASLPPRTPRPVYAAQDAFGNTFYYYADGTLVPGQGVETPLEEPAPLVPTQTPWQSLGDGVSSEAPPLS